MHLVADPHSTPFNAFGMAWSGIKPMLLLLLYTAHTPDGVPKSLLVATVCLNRTQICTPSP